MNQSPMRVANISGFYGDRLDAFAEMLAATDDIDVITGDYLAELTMLILWKAQRKSPDAGYARTFLTQLERSLGTCIDRGIRVVVNAGGLNPMGLADAIDGLATRLGVDVRVGVVDGDDVRDRFPEADVVTANAYLGGFGIAECLRHHADIVVTGRVTDAALVVGPAAWWHDWSPTDLDQLAGAVVAGHIIECGPQATGGNYPFAEELPDHRYPGYPIAEIHGDGTTVITKPTDTGGVVSVGTVTAQLLYEIQDPGYRNPDVTARFDTIRLRDVGRDRVEVSSVRGDPPPEQLKVALTTEGGWRNEMTLVFTGLDIEPKIERATTMLSDLLGGFDSFDEHDVQVLQAAPIDAPSNPLGTVQVRMVVKDRDRDKVDRRFSNAVTELLLASYAGAFTTAPPSPARQYGVYRPAFIDREFVSHRARLPDGEFVAIAAPPVPAHPAKSIAPVDPPAPPARGPTRRVPLGAVCGARSGDKGGNANVGVWARTDASFDWLQSFLTTDRLRSLLPEATDLPIERYELGNLRALNFVIEGLLDEGVASTTRFDPQAKGLGEYVRSRHVDVPVVLLENGAATTG